MRAWAAAFLAFNVLASASAASFPQLPPIGTKPVWSYSERVGPPEMLSTAKRYALTAQSLNRDCAQVTDLLAALSRARTSAKLPSRVISITKFLLKYGDRILGVDSSCDVARKLGAAATSLKVQAASVFPNCFPNANPFDHPCTRDFLMQTRLDKQKRDFAPDICYWTLSSGFLNLFDHTVKFLALHRGC